MFKTFRQALTVTNDNIILVFPLIIFFMIMNFYMNSFANNASNVFEFMVSSLTILFILSAFFAGWSYMMKKAISISKKVYVFDKDRSKASLGLIKLFSTGMGKYFLSFAQAFVIWFFVYFSTVIVVILLGSYIIGTPDAESMNHLQTLLEKSQKSPEMMMHIENFLTNSQLVFIIKWCLIFLVSQLINFFLGMYWISEIVYKDKNAFKALFSSIKKVFHNFLKSIGFFTLLAILLFVVICINNYVYFTPLNYLVVNVFFYYFMTYLTVLFFLFYDNTFNNDTHKQEILDTIAEFKNNDADEE
ncbi:MAG: hypothetical protein R3Y28_06230 [Candidatus Gastranaerophilales bacterium]